MTRDREAIAEAKHLSFVALFAPYNRRAALFYLPMREAVDVDSVLDPGWTAADILESIPPVMTGRENVADVRF